MNNKVIIF